MKANDIILNTVTVITGICAVLVTIHGLRPQTTGPTRAPLSSISASETTQLLASGHRIGPRTALLTVVEFGDFQCPVCGQYEPVLDSMRRRYPQTFAVVFHQMPLPYHPMAYPLARASECVAVQGRFVQAHDMFYRNQAQLTTAAAVERSIARLDIPNQKQFHTCFADTLPVPAIERDKALGTKLHIPGTPAIIVNDTIHTTDLSFTDLSTMLRHATSRSKEQGKSPQVAAHSGLGKTSAHAPYRSTPVAHR